MPNKRVQSMIVSTSGIRGVLNKDMTLGDVSRFAKNFATITGSDEILLARDPRSTSPAMSRAVAAGAMSRGCRITDYGIISTPALFRESRLKMKPGVMVTASHNEPEFNGLKFIVEGKGAGRDVFDAVVNNTKTEPAQFGRGTERTAPTSAYVEDLISRFGAGSLEGTKVALDMGGGSAITHAVQLLRRLGCGVVSINDSYGIFNRLVDPVADELGLLRKLVKQKGCSLGLGFDCDADRLVIVDANGRKRTGDYMLTLALSELIEGTGEKKVVVSQDTTQAVDEVVGRYGGQVFRSKVGEANVVALMGEKGARLGGEGSSGGLIDGTFNYCRDSMLAALVILRALKKKGPTVIDSVPSYHQVRLVVPISRTKAARGFKRLAGKYDETDISDGVKIALAKHQWVLVRGSATEDVVRVSAEAETEDKAAHIAKSFASKLKELSR